MKQEEAIRLINNLFGKEMAEKILKEYIPIRNKAYKPRSWLQAICHVAVGGQPFFSFK